MDGVCLMNVCDVCVCVGGGVEREFCTVSHRCVVQGIIPRSL